MFTKKHVGQIDSKITKRWLIKDWLLAGLLMLLGYMSVCFLVPEGYLFGSMIDWLNQHVTFADYFRQSFYETGRLFPDFAFDIGSGQNIYNFSYYGLYSPWLLLSYALPWISMIDYLPIIAVLTALLSACLCYRLIRLNGYTYGIAFLAAASFMWAVPVLFHAHRHFMFISYLPFLLLGLIAIEKYFQRRNEQRLVGVKIQIALSIFFCALSSYFFSPTCLIILGLYTIYCIIRERTSWKYLWVTGFWMGIGVLLASFLLVPTAMALLQGRDVEGSGGIGISVFQLLMPSFSPDWLVIDAYGLGFTPFIFFVLIFGCLHKRLEIRCLTLVLVAFLGIPGLVWLLNGTLYIKPKILIPFLPLYILLIAATLQCIKQEISLVTGKLSSYYSSILAVMLSMLFLFSTCSVSLLGHIREEWVSDEQWQALETDNKAASVQEVLAEDNTYFRVDDLTENTFTVNMTYSGANRTSVYSSVSNAAYNQAYFSLLDNPISARNRSIMASSPNIISQAFLGVEYVIARENERVPVGFHSIMQKGEWTVYQNKDVQALGYVMQDTISREQFEQLSETEQLSTIFQAVVLDREEPYQIKEPEALRNWWSPVSEDERIQFEGQLKEKVLLAAEQDISTRIALPKDYQDKIMRLQFAVSNERTKSTQDILIEINGVKNKLSKKSAPYPNENDIFTYILSSEKDWTNLEVELSEGTYEISNVRLDYMKPKQLFQTIRAQDKWIVKGNPKLANQYQGNITASASGYFVTTLPFDKGFRILVDGEPQDYEKVNTAFVGFPIQKGAHQITIDYTPPGKYLGIGLTLFTLCFLAVYVMLGKRLKSSFMNRIWRKYSGALREIFSYLFFGVLTTVVSFATFQLCIDLLHTTWQLANMISWICAVLFAYLTNRKWVFKSENTNCFKEFTRFAYYRVASLLIETVTLFILIEMLFTTPLIAKLIAAVLVVVANYIFSRLFVFRKIKKYKARKSLGEE